MTLKELLMLLLLVTSLSGIDTTCPASQSCYTLG